MRFLLTTEIVHHYGNLSDARICRHSDLVSGFTSECLRALVTINIRGDRTHMHVSAILQIDYVSSADYSFRTKLNLYP